MAQTPKSQNEIAIKPGVPRKKVFEALDGLRGIAAIAVVFYHLANWTQTTNLFPRGDLAVDFFFCLSGFVMAHAYADRLSAGMTFKEFFVIRMVRLYPMMALSIVIAGTYFVAKLVWLEKTATLFDLIGPIVAGFFVLPYFSDVSSLLAGPAEAYPLNGPMWSLFYELFINFAWALAFGILTTRRVFAFAIASAFLLTLGGLMHGDLLLGDKTYDFIWGIPRVGVTFAAGLLIYHVYKSNDPIRQAPYALTAALLIIPLMVDRTSNAIVFDAYFLFLLTPLIVLIGAKIEVSSRVAKYSKIAGEISYPIYVLHFPLFIWCNGMIQYAGLNLPAAAHIMICALFMVGGSWLALIYIDRPVRKYLRTWTVTKTKPQNPKPETKRERAKP